MFLCKSATPLRLVSPLATSVMLAARSSLTLPPDAERDAHSRSRSSSSSRRSSSTAAAAAAATDAAMAPISRKQHILDSLSMSDSSNSCSSHSLHSPSCDVSRVVAVATACEARLSQPPLPHPHPLQHLSHPHPHSHSPPPPPHLAPSGPLTGADLLLERSQYARVNRVILDKSSDEYRKRRERNNIAVKKSR